MTDSAPPTVPDRFAITFRAFGAYETYMEKRSALAAVERACNFCTLEDEVLPPLPVVEVGVHMLVVRNEFPYHVWESAAVVDHLMLIPRLHRVQFSEFTPEEMAEYCQLVQKWDGLGYSTFTRGLDAPGRSVAHIHTHLVSQKGSTLLSFPHPTNGSPDGTSF